MQSPAPQIIGDIPLQPQTAQQFVQQPQQVVMMNQAVMGAYPSTNATLALVLSCISFVAMGPLLSIPGLIIANGALKITDSLPGHPDAGMAKAARIVATINIVLTVVLIIFIMILVMSLSTMENTAPPGYFSVY